MRQLRFVQRFYLAGLLLLLVIALLISCEDVKEGEATYLTENVIIVVIDGPRLSETWADPTRENIPHLSGALMAQGAVYPNFRNNGVTNTTPGHVAITTGVYQEIDNRGNELPLHPSIFQYWKDAFPEDENSAWLIASKDKLEVLSDCQDAEWQGQYKPDTDCGVNGLGTGYREDAITFDRTMDILTVHHPRLALINFREPDYSGHRDNWENYIQGIQNTDEYIYHIWNYIQNDPIYRDKTSLFVTNDHGRHLDSVANGFISHGDNCTGCRNISLFALGPDFKKGVVLETPRELIDIPVTIAELMNFHLAEGQGTILQELFEE